MPVNTSLHIRIASDGFCADVGMDIDIKELARFVAGLARLYDSLSGEAILQGPYGLHNRIEFLAQKGGHVLVQGCLGKAGPGMLGQELQFSNMFDQTYLKPFTDELKNLVSSALPGR